MMKEPWIAFEGLGITLENVQRGITIPGGTIPFLENDFTIYWYGVLIALGFLLAVVLGLRSCEKFGISQDDLLTYIIVATPVAAICARLYFVIFKWEDYAGNLAGILDIRNGGLAIYGGVIGIVVTVVVMTRVKKQNVWNLLDFAMPYVLIGQAIGRWGNFFNQEAYGRETNLPWGMSGSNIMSGTVKVHPDFFYESVWCLLVFAFIMFYRKKLWKNTGELMCLYFIGYGIGRTFIEYIRGDDALLIGNQRVSLWLSAIFVLAFGAVFVYLRFLKKGPAVKVCEEAVKELEIRKAEEAEKERLDKEAKLLKKQKKQQAEVQEESNEDNLRDKR